MNSSGGPPCGSRLQAARATASSANNRIFGVCRFMPQSFEPDWLRERAIRRDVPHLEPQPLAAAQLRLQVKGSLPKGARVRKIDPLAINLLPVTRDHFPELQ